MIVCFLNLVEEDNIGWGDYTPSVQVQWRSKSHVNLSDWTWAEQRKENNKTLLTISFVGFTTEV